MNMTSHEAGPANERASAYVRRVSSAAYAPGSRAPLPHLDVELTERCNNCCVHCYINLPGDDAAARRRELDAPTLTHILQEAASLGCLSLRLTSGEPLLRPDFPEIYLAARRLGMLVTLYTNARLVTPELAALFARVPPRRPVEITVFGIEAATYEAISGVEGSFADFRRGVESLRRHGVPFLFKGVLLKENEQEAGRLRSWARELTGMTDPPGMVTTYQLRTRRDSPARNQAIRRLRRPAEQMVELFTQLDGSYRQAMETFCHRLPGPPGDRLFTCGAGTALCLDAYGRLQACMLVRHPETTYDLGRGSLRDALEQFFPTVLARRAQDPAYLERCARCFLHVLCDQCPGSAWSEHGTLDSPVGYLCELAHTQARAAGLLHRGERGWEVEDWKERIACMGR